MPRAFALIAFVALLAQAPRAEAQQDAIRVLEEEINLLKETIEEQNRDLRKLRERVKKLEGSAGDKDKAVADMRRRLERIDVLEKELQAVEARLTDAKGGGGGSGVNLGAHVDIRVRPELSLNRTDVNDGIDDDDAFWGHRARLGMDVGWDQWVRARIVVQEARKFGVLEPHAGGLSLHEAYLELLPEIAHGLRVKAGRMELSYGGERLVGRDDFSFEGRAFDGAIIGYSTPRWFDGEVFYTKLRESGLEGEKDFFGAYLSTGAIPHVTLDVYYMGLMDTFTRDVDSGGQTQSVDFDTAIHSIGLRVEAIVAGLRFDGEATIQLGKKTDTIDPTKELDHFATAFFADLSYQIPVPSLPEIGAFFAYASGDSNPRDGKSIDFVPLFPTRHSFLGTMDLFSWSNLIDIGGNLEFTLPHGWGIFTAVHYFLLEQRLGKLSGLGGAHTPPGTASVGRNVGIEIDAALSWSPHENLGLQLGYSIFLPSTVPEQLQLGSDKAQWAYLQARVQY